MTDREFLMWLHEHLEKVHGESPLVDYMRRLRQIVFATSAADKSTWAPATKNIEELRRLFN